MAAHTAEQERTMPAERRATLMGTEAHVIVIGDDAAHLADVAVARLQRLEARWSRFLPDSEISRLNNSPGVPVLVTPETFRLIDSQRVHFRDGVRVHGFVTNGGQAVNIIPEDAACEFSVRASDLHELARVKEIVERYARGAALAAGVEVTLAAREGYRDIRNNMTIARRFGAALEALGRAPKERDASVGAGSTDMGDVSHVVPSIHPYLAICDPGETLCHEHRFAERAGSDRGMATMLVAAKAMARTAFDLLEDEALLTEARREFEA